jgi:hypothetical protein
MPHLHREFDDYPELYPDDKPRIRWGLIILALVLGFLLGMYLT